MNAYNIYEDIATRTGGDIYLGVVGPVRCGKSTFISKFVDTLVLPNIQNQYDKDRTIDELPQSADGKTVMTTQPKFIPNKAVNIKVQGNTSLNVRLIDCVGYMVKSALNGSENGKARLVKTPWREAPMPFDEAAEMGTKKVVTEHSTIAVAMTTDGTFSGINRSEYIEAEEKVISELKASNKPFVVVLNSSKPQDEQTQELAKALSKKYNACVMALDVANMQREDIDEMFGHILADFPLTSLKVKLPKWIEALPYEDTLIQEIVSEAKALVDGVSKVGQVDSTKIAFEGSEMFEPITLSEVKMGEGIAVAEIVPKPNLFYIVLSKQCGCEISSDYHLIKYIKSLAHAKAEYDKLKDALDQVEQTGYGVVSPKIDELTLEEPEIVKQGSSYGVKLKASAPSLHIMKVDIKTEISPVVGTEQQSSDLVKYILAEFESNPQGIWETNMFGKSLHSLVNEGLNNKLVQMPIEAQTKMRKTLGRIVNEGKGGIICILL